MFVHFPFLSIASEKENEEMALHRIIQYVEDNYAVALSFMWYWMLIFLNATMEYHSISWDMIVSIIARILLTA